MRRANRRFVLRRGILGVCPGWNSILNIVSVYPGCAYNGTSTGLMGIRPRYLGDRLGSEVNLGGRSIPAGSLSNKSILRVNGHTKLFLTLAFSLGGSISAPLKKV